MAMELRHLRYFIAVAEEGHITRAAERLGMQQPPLSQQIKALERQLDVQLFRRKARGVDLTDAGRAFLDHARTIFLHLEQGKETTQRAARGEKGQIKIGITSTAPFHPFVPFVFRVFLESFPQVSMSLEDHLYFELIEHVQSERLDVAFIRTQIANPDGLVVVHLMDEPMLVALPKGHPLNRKRKNDTALPIKALAGATIIPFGPPGTGMFDAAIAACHAAGFSPRVSQPSRIATTLNLVAAGLGVSIVPASLRRMRMDGVVYRRLRAPVQPKANLSLAWRRGDPSPVVRNFVNLIRRAAKDFREDSGKNGF
jgi:DNA-binding transcriptional LysR family regulator